MVCDLFSQGIKELQETHMVRKWFSSILSLKLFYKNQFPFFLLHLLFPFTFINSGTTCRPEDMNP